MLVSKTPNLPPDPGHGWRMRQSMRPGPEHHHPCGAGQQIQLGHEHSGRGRAYEGMQPIAVGLGDRPHAGGRRPDGLPSSPR
jgi:hypothetical protein